MTPTERALLLALAKAVAELSHDPIWRERDALKEAIRIVESESR